MSKNLSLLFPPLSNIIHTFYRLLNQLMYICRVPCVHRLTITASCPMNLQYFPMDRQLCNIEIESCKYPSGATPEPTAACVCASAL